MKVKESEQRAVELEQRATELEKRALESEQLIAELKGELTQVDGLRNELSKSVKVQERLQAQVEESHRSLNQQKELYDSCFDIGSSQEF